MGKNDFLTPKAIGNRIKSKGLQKLRWYCQMCQKQCRDENGFKCHLTSESHKRQMMVFGENPDRVIDGYSEEFLGSFMEHLRRSHPSTRVSAKVVYNEYIANKDHVHMNSTRWLTLTDFVKYLGREGLCKVDQTEKGWHLVYQKKAIEEELEEERKRKRHKAEKEEEERQQDYLDAQIARAAQVSSPAEGPSQATELLRDGTGGVALRMALPKSRLGGGSVAPPSKVQPTAAFRGDDNERNGGGSVRSSMGGKPRSKQEEIMRQEQTRKKYQEEREAAEKMADVKKNARKDQPWLHVGLMVKVVSKELKEQGYYKEKGVVENLATKYQAQIAMLKSGDLLQVDQTHLETVLPSVGGSVKILKGANKGHMARLEAIDIDKFQAQIQLSGGEKVWMEYEDICKVQS